MFLFLVSICRDMCIGHVITHQWKEDVVHVWHNQGTLEEQSINMFIINIITVLIIVLNCLPISLLSVTNTAPEFILQHQEF